MIKTAPKAIRQKSTRDLEEELDKIASLIVRARTPYCVLCSSIIKLECAHYFPRFLRPTRWDFDNLATLCGLCNFRHEENPEPYRIWLIRRLGKQRFYDLERHAHANLKLSYSELLAMLKGRKKMYEEIRRAT